MKYFFHNGMSAGENLSSEQINRINGRGVVIFPANEKDKHRMAGDYECLTCGKFEPIESL